MFTLLLVEDDPDQSALILKAISKLPHRISVKTFDSVDAAVGFFEANSNEGSELRQSIDELKCLMLLDLNLGLRSGFEVMDYLRARPAFESLPVVILSATRNAEDIRQSYKNRAVCFNPKPFDPEVFSAVLTQLLLTSRIKL